MQQTSSFPKPTFVLRVKLSYANYISKSKFAGAVLAVTVTDTFENDNSTIIDQATNLSAIFTVYTDYQRYATDNALVLLAPEDIIINRNIIFDETSDPQAQKAAHARITIHRQVSDHLLQLRRSLTNFLELNKLCENALLSCFDPELTTPLRVEQMALTHSLDLRSSQQQIQLFKDSIAARLVDKNHTAPTLAGQPADALAHLMSTPNIADLTSIKEENLYGYLTFRSELTKLLTQLNAQQTMSFMSEIHDPNKHTMKDTDRIKEFVFEFLIKLKLVATINPQPQSGTKSQISQTVAILLFLEKVFASNLPRFSADLRNAIIRQEDENLEAMTIPLIVKKYLQVPDDRHHLVRI